MALRGGERGRGRHDFIMTITKIIQIIITVKNQLCGFLISIN